MHTFSIVLVLRGSLDKTAHIAHREVININFFRIPCVGRAVGVVCIHRESDLNQDQKSDLLYTTLAISLSFFSISFFSQASAASLSLLLISLTSLPSHSLKLLASQPGRSRYQQSASLFFASSSSLASLNLSSKSSPFLAPTRCATR